MRNWIVCYNESKKLVDHYEVFESLALAQKRYAELVMDMVYYSVTIAAVHTSTDYEPHPVFGLTFLYESHGHTLEVARSLGFDDSDGGDGDELESDALDHIRSKGFTMIGEEVAS